MGSIKRLAAVATATFAALAAPVQALEVGQKRHVDIATDKFKAENWEPVSVHRVGLPESMKPKDNDHGFPPGLKTADKNEDSAPAGKDKPPEKTHVLIVFNQKNTDKWRIATIEGNTFQLRAEGDGMVLSPAVEPKEEVPGVDVSYRLLQPQPVQDSPSGLCGPMTAFHEKITGEWDMAPVMQGVDKGGKRRYTIYASYTPRHAGWALVGTDTRLISCVQSRGVGFKLDPDRDEFWITGTRKSPAPN